MSLTSSQPESPYIGDILDQNEALSRTLAVPLPVSLQDFADRLRAQESPYVVLTGMGSSFHALRPLAIRLAEAGIRSLHIETSELVYYEASLLTPGTIVVAVSQSGRSAEMIHLIQINAGSASLIAVTNDATSPLALAADCLVLIDAGIEATVSCKTYTCTLLVLSRIGEVLSGGNSDAWNQSAAPIPSLVQAYLESWSEHVQQIKDLLGLTQRMILVGRGPSLASAGTGGLIIKEAARFHAEGMSSPAFRHGPLEMVNQDLFVLVFRGDDRSAEMNLRLATEVRALGGRSEIVSEASPLTSLRIPAAAEIFRPIMEVLPVQMFTLALAARKGLQAGSFIHISKVTSVE